MISPDQVRFNKVIGLQTHTFSNLVLAFATDYLCGGVQTFNVLFFSILCTKLRNNSTYLTELF